MHLLNSSLLTFIRENRWLLLALCFFVVWKIFLVHTLWLDRLLPPVPDDSLVYALHIDATLNCPNFFSCHERAINLGTFAGYDHLTYRLFVGTVGKIFSLGTIASYEVVFYIGILILAIALLFFSRSLNPGNKKLAAYSLFLFALFNGSGSFHGFYWVVPSFFAFVFFILIAGLIIDEKRPFPWCWLFILSLLGLFTHIIFLYSLLIFVLYFVFFSLFTRKFEFFTLAKIAFVIFIACSFYFPVETHYKKQSLHSPYGPLEITDSILHESNSPETALGRKFGINLPDTNKLFSGWSKINNNYFRWVFPNLLSYIAFCICFAILFYFKQYRLLSLYLASLVFTLVSTLNINGERSLLFLWPFTFLYFGHGAWFSMKIIQEKCPGTFVRMFLKLLTLTIVIFFVFLTLLYSYLWNKYLNQAGNLNIQPGLVEYIFDNTQNKKLVSYSEKAYVIDLLLLLKDPENIPQRSADPADTALFIAVSQERLLKDKVKQQVLFSNFFAIVTRTLDFKRSATLNEEDSRELPERTDLIFSNKKTFGDINVYTVSKKPWSSQ